MHDGHYFKIIWTYEWAYINLALMCRQKFTYEMHDANETISD